MQRFVSILTRLALLLFTILPISTANSAILHSSQGFSLHKETWIMPGSFSNQYQKDKSEAVFQISVKQQLGSSSLYFAYTQKSFWQVCNTDESSPFRETNYNPEIFYRVTPGNIVARLFGNGPIIGNIGMDIGFEHESNGRSMPESRSWNRAYMTPWYDGKNILLWLKLWYITPDSEEPSEDGKKGSNNPDIADYMGYGEFNLEYQFAHQQLIHLMVRGTPGKSKGAVSLTWSVPMTPNGLFFMIRGFHGYGESLIDYNRSISRIGAGFMISR